jgi:hypothetical protein
MPALAHLATLIGTGSSGGTLSHHSKIVFGMLVEILRFDRIAIQHRVSRKRQVALIVPLRVRGGAVLPVRGIAAAGRWPAPLWPLISPVLVHSLNLL